MWFFLTDNKMKLRYVYGVLQMCVILAYIGFIIHADWTNFNFDLQISQGFLCLCAFLAGGLLNTNEYFIVIPT